MPDRPSASRSDFTGLVDSPEAIVVEGGRRNEIVMVAFTYTRVYPCSCLAWPQYHLIRRILWMLPLPFKSAGIDIFTCGPPRILPSRLRYKNHDYVQLSLLAGGNAFWCVTHFHSGKGMCWFVRYFSGSPNPRSQQLYKSPELAGPGGRRYRQNRVSK